MNRAFILKSFFVIVCLILAVPFVGGDLFASPTGMVTAMFIESFTGVTEKVDLQIQKTCKAVAVIAVGATPLSNTVLISMKLVKQDGNIIMYQDMPANDLAEIMSQDEGLFMKDMTNYVGSFPFASARSIHIYPVGFGGAIPLLDNDYLSVDLRGLSAGVTYRVYALESMDQDGELWDIEKKAVAAPRANQKWNVNGKKLLALPKTNLTQIQIFSKTPGKDAIYTAEELGIMSFFENDVVCAVTRAVATTPVVNIIDLIFGYDNLFLINIEDALSYEIYVTGVAGYSFYEANAQAMIGYQFQK
jgi:hypothetical protein